MSRQGSPLADECPSEAEKGRVSLLLAGSLEAAAPSTLDEKQHGEFRSSNIPAETTQESDGTMQTTDAASVEYPTGLKLVSIILALVLGIFLASLDMVSPGPKTNCPWTLKKIPNAADT